MQTCLVNLVDLDPPVNGGAARVALAVCQMLVSRAKDDPDLCVVFVVNWAFAGKFHAWVGDDSALVIPFIVRDVRHGLTPLLQSLNLDFLVSPLFGMQPFDQIAALRGIPHVVAIPDTLALDKPELFTPAQLRGRKAIYAALTRAARIVTVSEFARHHLIDQLALQPDRVRVAYHGSELAEGGVSESEKSAALPGNPYVFYPANTWAHKRHGLLFQVMTIIWRQRPDIRLVLTGGRTGSEIDRLVDQFQCRDKVVDLGYVSDTELQQLYAHAEAMIFTPEYEGFGMPLVEAMQHGCPVICAPLTAIPEIAGDAVLYVDSHLAEDWARAFLETLPDLREDLIQRGKERAAMFTWDSAKQAWATILTDAGLNLEGRNAVGTQHAASLPDIAFDIVLAELNDWHQRIVSYDMPAAGVTHMAHLQDHLRQIEAIRRSENNTRLAQIPLIGYVVRLFIRFRNLARMWQANEQFYAAVITQLDRLESRLDAEAKSGSEVND